MRHDITWRENQQRYVVPPLIVSPRPLSGSRVRKQQVASRGGDLLEDALRVAVTVIVICLWLIALGLVLGGQPTWL